MGALGRGSVGLFLLGAVVFWVVFFLGGHGGRVLCFCVEGEEGEGRKGVCLVSGGGCAGVARPRWVQ